MAEHHAEIIFVKRHGGHHDEGHHGGAWKIAFADFMTAMMAFFLVLWIINATDKDTKTVIARYFNPVKLENPALATKGLHGVDSKTKTVTRETGGQETPGAPVDPKPSSEKESKSGGASTGDDPPSKSADKSKHYEAPAPDPSEPAAAKPTMPESELFSDPYRSLDKIAAARPTPSPNAGADTGPAEPTRQAGAMTVDAFRDPFKPIDPSANENITLDAGDAPPSPTSAEAEPKKSIVVRPPALDASQKPMVVKPPAPDASQKPNVDKPSVPDQPSEPAKAADAAKSTSPADAAHQPRLAAAAAELLKELKDKLGALAKTSAGPAIDVQSTDEGLLISLTDRMNFSMFAVGSAEPSPAVVQAMESIGKILQERPGAIVLRGHTDGRAYRSQTYDNWRLSSARAQMAYYMLTRAGVPEARFARVEGYANRALKDPAHPLSADNRRIEILLHTGKP